MIFYFLIAVFGFLVASYWLLNLVIFGVAKITKKTTTALYAGKSLLISSGVGVLFLLGLRLLFFPSPTRIYRASFGENPSPDVINLQGFSDGYWDSQVDKLRFQATPATIHRLAKIQKLPLVASTRFDRFYLDEAQAPDWWHPQVGAQSQLYAVDGRRGNFYNECVILLYDPQTRIAYYSFVGID